MNRIKSMKKNKWMQLREVFLFLFFSSCSLFSFFLIALFSLIFLFWMQRSEAFVFVDPTNLVQNTATAMNTANQAMLQAKQLEAELKDIRNYDGNIGQWANEQRFLYQLAHQIQQGQALAYQMQNIDRQYRSHFPGYVAPIDYEQAYRDWAQTTHDTLLSTLASAGMQAAHFATEQSQLNELARLSRTAEGRMQAVQVGNMIATQQVSQLQALRQLIITQMNAQNTYAAYQTQKDNAIEASTANWISASNRAFPVYGKQPHAQDPNDVDESVNRQMSK